MSDSSSNTQGEVAHLASDSFRSKRIIITGAAQGLGAELARYLGHRGARIIVADIQEDRVAALAAELTGEGMDVRALGVNVASWDSAESLIRRGAEFWGGIDGLVNNAGILSLGGPVDDERGEGGRRVIEVNLIGTYFVGLAAIQHWSRTGSHGSMVNITSGVQAGLGDAASYGASKGGVASLTYSWAIDCAPLGVRVNAFGPVATTEMVRVTEARLRERGALSGETRVVPPERNCPGIAYLLSDAAADINGQVLRIHDRALQLLAHPVVMDEETSDEWSVDGVAEAVARRFVPNLPPLGLTAATVTYRAMSRVNVVPGVDLSTGTANAGARDE